MSSKVYPGGDEKGGDDNEDALAGQTHTNTHTHPELKGILNPVDGTLTAPGWTRSLK